VVEPAEVSECLGGEPRPRGEDQHHRTIGDGAREREEDAARVRGAEVEILHDPEGRPVLPETVKELDEEAREGVAAEVHLARRLVLQQRRERRRERGARPQIRRQPVLEPPPRTRRARRRRARRALPTGDTSRRGGTPRPSGPRRGRRRRGASSRCPPPPRPARRRRVLPAHAPGLAEGAQRAGPAAERRVAPHVDGRSMADLVAMGLAALPPARLLPLAKQRRERVRGGRSARHVLLDQRPDDLGEERRDPAGDRVQARRGHLEVGVDDRGDALHPEGIPPGGQLVEDDAERVEVGGRNDGPPAELLRRRVGEGPHEGALGGEGHRLLDEARDAEVHEPDAPVLGDEDVVGLHVAVDDPAAVDRRQPLRRLQGQLPEHRFRQVPDVPEEGPHGASLDVLHDQEAAGFAVELHDFAVEGADDVGVPDPPAGQRLPARPLQAVGPVGEMRMHQLDGDQVAGRVLLRPLADPGEMDATHPSRSEPLQQDVGTDPLVRGRSRSSWRWRLSAHRRPLRWSRRSPAIGPVPRKTG
jgi:hypothetical protein